MMKLMIFAGTTEGRELCEKCVTDERLTVDAYVATNLGGDLLPKGNRIEVHIGRLDAIGIASEINRIHPDMVIDATHPYAEEVTKNILLATNATRTSYIRLIRKETPKAINGIYAEDYAKAVKIVNRSRGNILITTGSKELERYKDINDLEGRAYVRMLPEEDNVIHAIKLGFNRDNIELGKGPYSVEQNIKAITKYNIKYLITKDTGEAGGFPEKEEACRRCNVAMIVISKPIERGYEFDKVWQIIQDKANQKKVSVIGVGMGNPANMTIEAAEAIKEAEVIIGSERLVKGLDTNGKVVSFEYRAGYIADYIKCTKYANYAVVFSGDMCMFSGGSMLVDKLSGADYELNIYQGISSVAYLASKLNLNWADAKIASMHGTDEDVVKLVSENKSLYLLTGDNINDICKKLCDAKLTKVKVCVGERLSYLDERVLWGYPQDFLDKEFNNISTMYIENDDYGKPLMTILNDDEFERADGVPMTKRDIRCAVIDRLNLSTNSIVYDIGAGTGAVSVEIARRLDNGKLYSFEIKPEAVALLNRNKQKFMLNNMTIIEGDALNNIQTAPQPDIVFIGGSNGNIRPVISNIIAKGRTVRIVLTAVVLETAYEAMKLFNELSLSDNTGFKNIELTQVNVANGKKLGERTMMTAHNPVFIISADYVVGQ